jgi:1-acyl-sn-glycerol-3-phosphate acyltransferase
LLPFKKGAFYMARQAGVPVVPVAIKNSDVLMGKGTGEACSGTIEMVFMRPIETVSRTTDEAIDQLIAEARQMVATELETVTV